MDQQVKILVVEDDRAVNNLITAAMETQGYAYEAATTGKDGVEKAEAFLPHVMILDLGLPDMDGVEIIRRVRTWSNLPILVVSARSDDRDKIGALDAGADDYLVKPFSVDELLARIRVALRKMRYDASGEAKKPIFRNGGLIIDYRAGCVLIDGAEVHLTPIEYKLLCLLAQNAGKVLTHNYILKEIWLNVLPGDKQSLRVFMATLRKKIEKDPANPMYIQTHIGVGYRLIRIQDGDSE